MRALFRALRPWSIHQPSQSFGTTRGLNLQLHDAAGFDLHANRICYNMWGFSWSSGVVAHSRNYLFLHSQQVDSTRRKISRAQKLKRDWGLRNEILNMPEIYRTWQAYWETMQCKIVEREVECKPLDHSTRDIH